MTTHLAILALLAGFATSVFGQGQVTLANNASSLIRIGDPTNGFPIPISSMSFQLYVGTVGTPESSLTPLLPIAGTSTTIDGRIRNTVIDVYPQFPVAYPGRIMTFQIWAWSSSFATYPDAVNGVGLVGKSITFEAFTSPDSPNGANPENLAGRYPAFAVNAIPEPSSLALLTLGGTAVGWVLRWRRKKLQTNQNSKMKTRLTILVLLAGSAVSVFGQGQVLLNNNASTLIRIGDPVNGAPIPVSSMSFQLHVGTLESSEDSLTPLLPIAPTSSSTPGRIFNTVIDVSLQFPPAYPGGLVSFQIWAWSSSFATYQDAVIAGGLVGKSVLFPAYISPFTDPPTVPTSLAGSYPGFAVNPVPEPSTFALLVVCASAFWLVMRWRQRRL